jgi:hypothetical protein
MSTARLVAMTTDRNATVSSTNARATTVRISQGIRAPTTSQVSRTSQCRRAQQYPSRPSAAFTAFTRKV